MKVLYQQGAIMMGEKGKRGEKSEKVLIGRRFGLNSLDIHEMFTQRDQGLNAALFEW